MALAKFEDTVLQSDSGRAYAGIVVEALSGGEPVQLYRDAGGSEPASQITTNANGLFTFWVGEGTYTIRYSLGGVTLASQAGVEIYNLVKAVDLADEEGAENVGVATGDTLQDFLDTLDQASTQKVNADAIGVSGSDANMGTTPGTILSDNATAKQWFQESEAAIEAAQVEINRTVFVDRYGVGLDWDDDWGPAFTAASNAAGAGGTVLAFKRYTLLTEPFIQDGVTIRGPWTQPDEILPSTSADYDGRNGTIFIGSAAGLADGLNVNSSCAWEGLTIMPQGLDLPFANATAAAAGVAAFAGTAFNVAGPGATFRNLLILGFNKAIYSGGFERVRCIGVRGDCTNGIDIRGAYDIPEVVDCQFWPYTTVHQTWTTNALLRRTGTAFYGESVNDWMRWVRCFSYGYYRGFKASGVNTVTFMFCGADNTSTGGIGDHTGSIGFALDGTCVEPRWIGCQTAAQEIGYSYYNAGGNHGTMAFCEAWACSGAGLQVGSGCLTVIGGVMRSSPSGIGINNLATGTDHVNVVGTHFENLQTGMYNASPSSILRHDKCTFSGVSVQIVNAYTSTIASAASIVPNGTDFNYTLTGTTNVGSISSPARYAGRGPITLTTTSSLSILVGGNIKLKDNVNYAMVAGDALSVVSDGTNWNEVSRSKNSAWVSTFVPTISSTGGPITTSTASCQYKRDGATVHFSLSISVTTNGTGAGTLRATLPFSSSGLDNVFVGRDRGVGGKALTATLIAGGNTLDIKNYDNTYPAADGSFIMITGTYRAS